jgi:hypothetical protein
MRISLLATLILLAVSAFGQTQPTNFYAAGVSYNNSGSPVRCRNGNVRSPDSRTKQGRYAFTVLDALPSSFKPFTVTSSFIGGPVTEDCNDW